MVRALKCVVAFDFPVPNRVSCFFYAPRSAATAAEQRNLDFAVLSKKGSEESQESFATFQKQRARATAIIRSQKA